MPPGDKESAHAVEEMHFLCRNVDQETFQAGIQKRNIMEIWGRNLMDPSLSSGQLKKEEKSAAEIRLLVCLGLEVLLYSFSIWVVGGNGW